LKPKRTASEITGMGAAVPEKVLTNFDLAKMVDTSDEWIRSRTGIRERRIAEDNETTSEYGHRAARLALDQAGLSPKDLDLIIVGTVTPDMCFPSTACFIQEKLGAVNAAAFDVSAACAGFIYSLSLADGMIAAGKYKNILVLGVELLSRITNWEDRSTCVLFGDGAGAAVLQPSQGDRGIVKTYIRSDGRLNHLLKMPGGSTIPPSLANSHNGEYFIQMEGREVFRHAVNCMGEAATKIIEENGFTGDEISLVIPHQANIRIIEAVAKRLDVPSEKVYINVDRFGNTSSASIPIALYEAQQRGMIKGNDLVLLVGFGGGFTWGSALIRF
jgi:3-oxoacyl-[acyl-carrier-protein] synthase-3